MSFESRGEARSRGGLRYQDKISAMLIYEGLVENSLDEIRFLNPNAGKLDDCIIKGKNNILYFYQIKHRDSNITMKNFRSDEDEKTKSILVKCYYSYISIIENYPDEKFRLKWLTNKKLSTRKASAYIEGIPWEEQNFSFFWNHIIDKIVKKKNLDSIPAIWKKLLLLICSENNIPELDFINMISHLEFVENQDWEKFKDKWSESKLNHILSLAERINSLISDNRTLHPFILSSNIIINEMRWDGRFKWEQIEIFSSPQYGYIHDQIMEKKLINELLKPKKKYIGIIGSPGSGKSTFLNTVFRNKMEYECLYYFLYTPDQNLILNSIGDEYNFIKGLVGNVEKKISLNHDTLIPSDFDELYRRFIIDLNKFSEKLHNEEKTGLFIIDGLDHINREYKGIKNLCLALPKMDAIPNNIIFLLGSQTFNIEEIPSSVKMEIANSIIEMIPFSIELTQEYIKKAQIELNSNELESIYRLSQGHPLYLKYIVEYLKIALNRNKSASILEILAKMPPFSGNIYKYYEEIMEPYRIVDNQNILDLLNHLCRISFPFDINIFLKGGFIGTTIELFLENFSFLFKKQGSHFSFFHNSFRQFLLKDINNEVKNKKLNEHYHNNLFKLYSSFEQNQLEFFNALEHAIKSNNVEFLKSLNLLEHTISQFKNFRPKSLIRRDISILLDYALYYSDFDILIDSILAGIIFQIISWNISSIENTKILIKLERIDQAKKWIFFDNKFLISESEARSLISWFIEYDLDFARNLFNYSDPTKEMNNKFGIYFSENNNLNEWILNAPNFWKFKDIYNYIEEWSFRDETSKYYILLYLLDVAIQMNEKEYSQLILDTIPESEANLKMNAFLICIQHNNNLESWYDQIFNLLNQNLSKEIISHLFKIIINSKRIENQRIIKAIISKYEEILFTEQKFRHKYFFSMIPTYLNFCLINGKDINTNKIINGIEENENNIEAYSIPTFIKKYISLHEKLFQLKILNNLKGIKQEIVNFFHSYSNIEWRYCRDLQLFIDWEAVVNFIIDITFDLKNKSFLREIWEIFCSKVIQRIQSYDQKFNRDIILNFYEAKIISRAEAKKIWFEYTQSQKSSLYTYDSIQINLNSARLLTRLGEMDDAYHYLCLSQNKSLGFLNDKDIQLEAYVIYLIHYLRRNDNNAKEKIKYFFDLLNHANEISDTRFFEPAKDIFSYTLNYDYNYAFSIWKSDLYRKNILINLETGFKLIFQHLLQNSEINDAYIVFLHLMLPLSSSASWDLSYNLAKKLISLYDQDQVTQKISTLFTYINTYAFSKTRKEWQLGIGLAIEKHEFLQKFMINIDNILDELKPNDIGDIRRIRSGAQNLIQQVDLDKILSEKINFYEYWRTKRKFEILRSKKFPEYKEKIIKYIKENLSRTYIDSNTQSIWIVRFLDEIVNILFNSEKIPDIWPHIENYLYLLDPTVDPTTITLPDRIVDTSFWYSLLKFIFEHVYHLSNYHIYSLTMHFFKKNNDCKELKSIFGTMYDIIILISSYLIFQKDPKQEVKIKQLLKFYRITNDIDHMFFKRILGEEHPNIYRYTQKHGKVTYNSSFEEEKIYEIDIMYLRKPKPSFIDVSEIAEIHLNSWKKKPTIQFLELNTDYPKFPHILSEVSFFKIFSHSCIIERREVQRIQKPFIEFNYRNHFLTSESPVPMISLKQELIDELKWSFNKKFHEFTNYHGEIIGKIIMWQDGNVFHKPEVIFQYAGIGCVLLLSQQGYQELRQKKSDIISKEIKVIRQRYSEEIIFDFS